MKGKVLTTQAPLQDEETVINGSRVWFDKRIDHRANKHITRTVKRGNQGVRPRSIILPLTSCTVRQRGLVLRVLSHRIGHRKEKLHTPSPGVDGHRFFSDHTVADHFLCNCRGKNTETQSVNCKPLWLSTSCM